MKGEPIFPKFKGLTALVLALLRVLILELWNALNLRSSALLSPPQPSSALLRRNEGWAHLSKVQGIHSSRLSALWGVQILELCIPSNLHSSALLGRNGGWALLPKDQGIHSSSISTRGVLILELWNAANPHSSALLRRNEGWAHLPKVQGIHNSGISTLKSTNTRAVNPSKPPLLSPPQK